MTGLALLLAAAALAFGFAKWLRLPAIPLLLLAGFGLKGLANLAGIDIDEADLSNLVEMGLAVLVFAAGIDLSPQRLKGRLKPILVVGISQFVVLGSAGIGLSFLLNYDLTTALYIGCALSASSTIVVVKQLQNRQIMFTPFGRLVLGILLLQDVTVIFLIVALIHTPDGAMAVAQGLGKTFGLAMLAYAVHRWAIPIITGKMRLDDEERMLFALGTLFLFTTLANFLGLPFIVGGFLAGFALSAFPMNGLIRGMIGSITSFFLALFFISIGFICTIPNPEMFWHAAVFVIVLVIITVVLVTYLAERTGYSTRASIESGVLLSQTSEFSLLVAFIGLTTQQISAEIFSMITLITVGTMTLTPFIAKDAIIWKLMRLHPRNRNRSQVATNLEGHAIIIGFGQSGPKMLKAFSEAGVPVLVIDDDAAVIKSLLARGIDCIEGDGSDPLILDKARARYARALLATIRRTRDATQLLEAVKGSDAKVIIRTFEPNDRTLVERNGGIAVDTVEAATKAFMDWYDVNLVKAEPAASEA
ncbi:MAG: hypothetical protein EA353_13720 [Puniceicoccaceae bacterium]|nr:MAG: hypothetical protein EA353_13720 [Puniceicoccaceae bacterium]